MACIVRDERLSAIYNTARALQDEKGLTFDEVLKWFAENRPAVGRDEVMNSYVAASPKAVKLAAEGFKNTIKRIELQKTLLKAINDLDLSKPNNKGMDVVKAATDRLYGMILSDPDIKDPAPYLNDLSDIQLNYNNLIFGNADMKIAAKSILKDRLKNVSNILKAEKSDAKIKELTAKILRLEDGTADVKDILSPEAGVVFDETTDELIEKETEIAHLRAVFEDYKAKRRARESASEGILGFKGEGSTAVKIRAAVEGNTRDTYETMRSLKFMFDASVIGVQLAPTAIADLTGINLNAIKEGDFANVFSSQKKLSKLMREQIWDIFNDDLVATKKAGDSKRAHGLLAIKRLRAIKSHPSYGVAMKSGLRISETRGGTKSEEMFRSSLLNKIPGLGLIKDVSEDMMISPLNDVRFSMFNEFLEVYPLADEQTLKKIAAFINEYTGTSSQDTGALADISLSAARLMLSRLSLAFYRPLTLLGAIDVKSTLQGKPGFTSPYHYFLTKHILRMWAGYARMFALVAAIGAFQDDDWWEGFSTRFGRNFEVDSSDYLRVKSGTSRFDFTGGIGGMYRMSAKMALIAFGPDDNESFLGKKRYNMFVGAQGQTILDPALEYLVGNKLHPTITGTASIITGKDFMGKPYHEWFGGGEFASRAEGALRAVLPIFMVTTTDQIKEEVTSLIKGEETDLFGGTFVSAVQFLGVSTFEGPKSGTIQSTDFLNKIGFRPVTNYPEDLKGEVSIDRDILRNNYKRQFDDMVGEVIESNPNMTKSQFQSRVKSEGKRLQQQFIRENKGDIDKLPKVGK